MDLDVIRKRLESLNKQSNNGGGERKNAFFKPVIGKQVIRILPSKYNKDIPFSEILMYYNIGDKKVIASPKNWGEKDPIMEFTKQLRSSNDKENWRLAKKLDPKTRIFVPVIVRGEEEEGVRLWQFGKEVYQEFLNMAADEEIGDYTDILQGRDIKLTTVGPEVTGTAYNKTSISPSLKMSPLSEDKDQVEAWLNNQPNPLTLNKQYTFDEIKESLQSWLSPEEDESEGDIISEPVVPFENETPKSNYSLSAKPKTTKADEFDSMFEEDDSDEDPFKS